MSKYVRKTDVTFNMTTIEVYNLVLSGKLSKFPSGYLTPNVCKELVRYVALEKLHMTREDICKKITSDFLQKHSLGGIRKKFRGNFVNIVHYCFDDMDIKPWEFYRVPDSFWYDTKNQKEFILWVIEQEHLDINKLSDLQKITSKMITKYGGSKARIAAGGTYELINSAICDKYKEWEVLKIDIWTEEKAQLAVRWLIEEKLKWDTDEMIYNNLTSTVFRENHLGGLLKNYCGNSPLKAINVGYPGRFKYLKYTNIQKGVANNVS